jgi:hypothetical protein
MRLSESTPAASLEEIASPRKSWLKALLGALRRGEEEGWIVISMKNDWKRIFAFELVMCRNIEQLDRALAVLITRACFAIDRPAASLRHPLSLLYLVH